MMQKENDVTKIERRLVCCYYSHNAKIHVWNKRFFLNIKLIPCIDYLFEDKDEKGTNEQGKILQMRAHIQFQKWFWDANRNFWFESTNEIWANYKWNNPLLDKRTNMIKNWNWFRRAIFRFFGMVCSTLIKNHDQAS